MLDTRFIKALDNLIPFGFQGHLSYSSSLAWDSSAGLLSVEGDLNLLDQHKVIFNDADSSNTVSVQAPTTVSSDYTLTLPSALPVGDAYLKASSAGLISFEVASGSFVTGSLTSGHVVVATGSSTIGGSAALTFSSGLLTATGGLDLGTTSNNDGILTVSASSFPSVRWKSATASTGSAILLANDGVDDNSLVIENKENASVLLRTNNISRWKIAKEGHLLGIGSDNTWLGIGPIPADLPQHALHIYKTANPAFFLQSSSTYASATPSNTAYRGTLFTLAGLPQTGVSNAAASNYTDSDNLSIFNYKPSSGILLGTAGSKQIGIRDGALDLFHENKLFLWDSDNTHYVAVAVPSSVTTSYTLTLPSALPATTAYVKASSSGSVSFEEVSGSFISGSLTSGQVSYATSSSTIGGSSNLFWNTSNNRLGIGTNSPQCSLHVFNTSSSDTEIRVTNSLVPTGVALGADSNSRSYLWTYDNRTFVLATNNTVRLGVAANTGDIYFGSNLSSAGYKYDSSTGRSLFGSTSGIYPTAPVQVYTTASSYLRFSTNLTGTGSNEGLEVGIDNDGTAYIWSYTPSVPLQFAVANAEVGRFNTAGNLELRKPLLLFDNDRTHNVRVAASGVTTTSYTLTLPPAPPASASYPVSDTSGFLSWEPVPTQILRLASVTGIDAKTVATTNLYTVPSGKSAIITTAIFRLTTVSGISGTLKAGIGVAAGENDILASEEFTAFNTTGKVRVVPVQGNSALATATSVIKLGIDTAFTGTTATLTVDLFGYLV